MSVQHLSRQMRAGWNWAEQLNSPDPMIRRAAECVQRDVRIASDWLLRQSAQLHFPLPMGNGTNGPWNRIPLIDADGRLVLLDICRGVAYHSDAQAPAAAIRLAVSTVSARSPHDAGGSGSMPVGCRQIALMLSPSHKSRTHVDMTARIIRVEHGFRTCYASVCSAADVLDWYEKFPKDRPLLADECQWVETTIPQRVRWETARTAPHIERRYYDLFVKFLSRRSGPRSDVGRGYQYSYANYCSEAGDCVRRMSWALSFSSVLGDISVTGTADERKQVFGFLDKEWVEFVEWVADMARQNVLAELGMRSRDGLPSEEYPPLRIVD